MTHYFDAQKFEEAVFEVQQAYNNDGYLYARVEPWIEKLDAVEGEGPVGAGRVANHRGESRLTSTGSRISGNEYTHERVIRERIYILPGDVYSQDRLLQSYQSIGALGFFETPLPLPDIEPDEQTGDVDITFFVEERQTGSINFGTAVGGGTGVSGFLGYDQPNLFGQAKEGHLRWDFGRYINSFTLSFTDPALFQSRVSGTLSLFNSRDRFFQFATGKRKTAGILLHGSGFPVPWSLRTQVFCRVFPGADGIHAVQRRRRHLAVRTSSGNPEPVLRGDHPEQPEPPHLPDRGLPAELEHGIQRWHPGWGR